jgi:pimeloyl-ACP methyl ester carboxylesterase
VLSWLDIHILKNEGVPIVPVLERGDVSIYYEEYGSGYPVMLFAPGSLLSSIAMWHTDPPSPYNPIKEFAADFRLIAMDQRNAGRSRAPFRAGDGWKSYAEDHLALMDHLHIDRAHALGACIGVSFVLEIFQDAPERLTAGVLQQPIGREDDSEGWTTRQVDGLAETLPEDRRPSPEVARSFSRNLYEQGFVYNVSRDFVRSCSKPMLVLPGNDKAHPYVVAKQIVELAPNAEVVENWRGDLPGTIRRVRQFLSDHTPKQPRALG